VGNKTEAHRNRSGWSQVYCNAVGRRSRSALGSSHVKNIVHSRQPLERIVARKLPSAACFTWTSPKRRCNLDGPETGLQEIDPARLMWPISFCGVRPFAWGCLETRAAFRCTLRRYPRASGYVRRGVSVLPGGTGRGTVRQTVRVSTGLTLVPIVDRRRSMLRF